ncbi:hypothetical protein [Alteromonas gracilis]|uniref:hypothetical protein n=1 Tax=Alteromonas gracilis TaxID=1479524 RepID=UPI003735B675
MRNLFTALKQDTHANHTTLEKTFPFSMYHKSSQFNKDAYAELLGIMQVFHQITTEAVRDGASKVPELNQISLMINSEAVLNAIKQDTQSINRRPQPLAHSVNVELSTDDEEASNIDTHACEPLLPQFSSVASKTIAAIYVWLGSSMGANIIARRLDAMEEDIPTQYYQAMASCAKTWVSFKQEVDALLPSLGLAEERFVKETVADANAWFEFLISMGIQAERNRTLFSQEELNAT